MNIPYSNPLFDWVRNQRLSEPISYVTLTVDGIEARLAYVGGAELHCSYDSEDYMSTEWILLRSHP